MNSAVKVAICSLTAGLMLTASPAEACRITQPVQIFHLDKQTKLPAKQKQWKVRFETYEWEMHQHAPFIKATVLAGSSKGREILIASKKAGPCNPVAWPKWGKEGWIVGRYMTFSEGSAFDIDGTSVIEVDDRFM